MVAETRKIIYNISFGGIGKYVISTLCWTDSYRKQKNKMQIQPRKISIGGVIDMLYNKIYVES